MKKSVLGKNWSLRPCNDHFAQQIIQYYQTDDLLSRVLSSRVESLEKIQHFLEPKIKHSLPDPFHLKDMRKGVERLYQALQNKEQICIFADYDVDGATSSALLKNFLRDIGHDAHIYVPDRIIEGYGPSEGAMQKIANSGVKLVITVDCGSVAFEAMQYAAELGLDVIIIDHHISLDTLPQAVAIINPNRLDEESTCTNLAAVGVSFLFVVAFCTLLTEKDFFRKNNITPPQLMNYLDLVALGTVCDVMQITGLNRAFVAQGLKIAKTRRNIGYKSLCDISGVNEALNCYHLGFLIGPRINAGGRVGKADLGARLLSCLDEYEAIQIARELDGYNEERKAIEMSIIQEADALAANQSEDAIIFVAQEGWHPGVIGIVAGRLKEKYNKPVAVVAINDGIGKASCRSVRGVDFGTALLKAKQQDMLIAGGGHAMAAGFTVTAEKISELRNFLSMEFSSILASSMAHLQEHYDIELSNASVSCDLVRSLSVLEPFGHGNQEPVCCISNLFVLKADIVGEKHIRVIFAPQKGAYGKNTITAISFNTVGTAIGDVLLSSRAYNLSVIGHLKINKWQNHESAQLQIQDIIIDID